MTHVAFLGTGLLGSGFVHGFLTRGTPVTAWNRTATKAAPLADAGATIATTIADAVRGATRVHLCLSADAAVDAVLAEVEAAAPADAIFIDHTTTAPALTAARAHAFAARGRAFVHAPVFMSPAAARAGAGIMMVAAPTALYEQVAPALRTMTGDLWFVGEDPARAAGLKLLGNAMLIAIAGGLADVLTVGAALGIPASDAHGVLARLKPGGAIELRGKRMAEGDFAASFELTMARKDMGLMIDAAAGRDLAVLASIAARTDTLIERGLGDRDLGVLAIDAVPERS